MRLRLPHPLALVFMCILSSAALTYVLPAGQFKRQEVMIDGAAWKVPLAGTYRSVGRHPIDLFGALLAVPKGIEETADVIALVFVVGAAFSVLDCTGAPGVGLSRIITRLGSRQALLIPAACALFGLGGVMFQMEEELIAFVPMLLRVGNRLGLRRVTVVAMSLGASIVGASFSPVDPFLVGIAQKVAGLRPFSAFAFRLVFLSIALLVIIAWVRRSATESVVTPAVARDAIASDSRLTSSHLIILGLVPGTFVAFLIGKACNGWGFSHMSASFLGMGILSGLIGGLGIGGTAEAFINGFRSMAYPAIFVGCARGISVVLEQGQVIDTIVIGLFYPLQCLPVTLTAVGMLPLQALIHIPVPSTSGQAVLTIPLLVSLSNLLGLSPQVTVLAYQYGAGLSELLSPTNGSMMAILAAAGVAYNEWIRFAFPLASILALLGVSAIILGIIVGI